MLGLLTVRLVRELVATDVGSGRMSKLQPLRRKFVGAVGFPLPDELYVIQLNRGKVRRVCAAPVSSASALAVARIIFLEIRIL